jgi:hypothetical protein
LEERIPLVHAVGPIGRRNRITPAKLWVGRADQIKDFEIRD